MSCKNYDIFDESDEFLKIHSFILKETMIKVEEVPYSHIYFRSVFLIHFHFFLCPCLCMNLKWVKSSNHWGPFSVLSDEVLYSFTFSSSWTQLFILLPVIPVSGHWGFILCKTEKMMAIVGYHIGTYVIRTILRAWGAGIHSSAMF